MMQRIVHTKIFMLIASFALAQNVTCISPDGKLKLTVLPGKQLSFTLNYMNKELLKPSEIAMMLKDQPAWGKNASIKKVDMKAVKQILSPVWGKRKQITDEYKNWLVDFANYSLEVRMFNNAAAYRWIGKQKLKEVLVLNEMANYHFEANDTMYFPTDNTFENSFEKQYEVKPILAAKPKDMAFLPILVKRRDGLHVAVTEADVLNYPAMHLKLPDSLAPVLQGIWARVPSQTVAGGHKDYNLQVKGRFDYIAKTIGARTYPWRLFVVSEDDGLLANNDFVYQLAEKQSTGDFSWVKPGKVVWDWWADWALTGVDFKAGINTATYKHYIDFAAESKSPYIILDEGWSGGADLFQMNPEVDVDELIRYGKSKNVKLILWCAWGALLQQMEPFMAQCQQKGIAGLKVDFFDRDDQLAMAALEDMAEAAARYQLTLDFHGVSKPTGLHRKFPNILNYEGVLGNEWNKWSDQVTAAHTIQIPFIRMLAGPMDFTPGGMRNTHLQGKEFPKVYARPFTQGTRCRQLAMYVLYEGGLQMLSDLPSEYRKEPQILEFLKFVPVSWDETKVLQAKVGKHLVMARKAGNSWYIGAMNDTNRFETTLKLDFLENGKKYAASIWSDGLNADKTPEDFKFIGKTVVQGDSLNMQLAKAGGLVVKLDLVE